MGDARLLDHLAALERLTDEPRPDARARLEVELGRDQTRFLLRALRPRRPGPASRAVG